MADNKNFRHIVRIANTDLDGNKQIRQALTKIKGVSVMLANAACIIANIDKQKKTGELEEKEIRALDSAVSELDKQELPAWLLNRRKDMDTGENTHLLSGDLRYTQENDVKMLKKVKAYRGMRHAYGRPVRGQRTRSNFRRNKGKVTGVQKKKQQGRK